MILHESQNLASIIANVQTKNQKDHQLVYASQLYGTFFAVGAKLTLSTNQEELTGIELSLNNYKGLYNIGFLEDTKDSWDIIRSTGVIVLHLQAYNGTNAASLQRTISMQIPAGVTIASLTNLLVTRKLESLSNATPLENHLDEAIFDSEFNVRNGKYIAKIQRLDTYLPDETQILQQAGINAPQSGIKNCMTTLVKLI